MPRVFGPSVRFQAPNFDGFFDRDLVQRRLDRKSQRVLSRIGGFIRVTARRSMRKGGISSRARTSNPGEPPRYHTKLLRGSTGSRFGVFFAYSKFTNSVVIGPNLMPGARNQTRTDFLTKKRVRLATSDTVPAILETGGSVTKRTRGKSFRSRIEKRPYMKPAFDKAILAPKLKQFWNQVRY